jgi:hypothetical protein
MIPFGDGVLRFAFTRGPTVEEVRAGARPLPLTVELPAGFDTFPWWKENIGKTLHIEGSNGGARLVVNE